MAAYEKMLRIRKASAAAAVLLVLQLGICAVFGANNQTFINGFSQESADSIEVICTIPGESVGEGTFTATIGTDEVDVVSVASVADAGVARTYYCLVDISGTMSGRMEMVQDALHVISEGMNDGDNLVLALMGNQVTESDFLSSQEEVDAAIDAIEVTREDTNLYSGIVQAISFLQQKTQVNEMPVLLVFSDGIDDNKAGSTLSDANEAIDDSDIPVYAFAPLLDDDSDSYYDGAKLLRSLAARSAGGLGYPTASDGSSTPKAISGEEAGTAMMEAVSSTYVIEIDLSGTTSLSGKDSYTLYITYDNGAGTVYEDSKEIAAKDILLPEATEESSDTDDESGSEDGSATDDDEGTQSGEGSEEGLGTEDETGADSESETKDDGTEPAASEGGSNGDDEEDSLPLIAIAGIVILIIVIAAVILIIVLTKKKKAKTMEDAASGEQSEGDGNQAAEALGEDTGAESQETQAVQDGAFEEIEPTVTPTGQAQSDASGPKLKVFFAVIGVSDKYMSVELVKNQEMTLGRNKRAKFVLNDQDKNLSSIHFTMLWTGTGVYIWDQASRNGTSVNGVVITNLGRVAVKPGDLVRAGSCEYRLYWEDVR